MMSFKINFLFILIVLNMLSMGYLCPAKKDNPPPKVIPKYCSLPADSGSCFTEEMVWRAGFKWRYHYWPPTKDCYIFQYGGCEGNKNNFVDYGDCMHTCKE